MATMTTRTAPKTTPKVTAIVPSPSNMTSRDQSIRHATSRICLSRPLVANFEPHTTIRDTSTHFVTAGDTRLGRESRKSTGGHHPAGVTLGFPADAIRWTLPLDRRVGPTSFGSSTTSPPPSPPRTTSRDGPLHRRRGGHHRRSGAARPAEPRDTEWAASNTPEGTSTAFLGSAKAPGHRARCDLQHPNAVLRREGRGRRGRGGRSTDVSVAGPVATLAS
jgi:hypothetical protein